jgi:protein-disulfide isomerase
VKSILRPLGVLVLSSLACAVSFMLAKVVGARWDETQAEGSGVLDAASSDRFHVPLEDSPSRGTKAALVTIVEFVDLHCYSCGRLAVTLAALLKAYPDDVALVVKHSPLRSTRATSMDAALLGELARERGQFWDIYGEFMKQAREVSGAAEATRAVMNLLGVSEADLAALRNQPSYLRRISRDLALAESLGAHGTPWLFINGRALRGDTPLPGLIQIVEHELTSSRALIARGTPRSSVYTRHTESALRKIVTAPRYMPRSGAPDSGEIYNISTEGAPAKGAAMPLVTIVVFSDFTCASCATMAATLRRLVEEHGDTVQVVWRDLPLTLKPNAVRAARVARAAAMRGGFWLAHDELFKSAGQIDQATIDRALRAALGRETPLTDEEEAHYDSGIASDMAIAENLGLRIAPTLFVNGQYVPGSVPFSDLSAKVERAAASARRLLAGGVPRSRLYRDLVGSRRSEI